MTGDMERSQHNPRLSGWVATSWQSWGHSIIHGRTLCFHKNDEVIGAEKPYQ